MLRRPPILILFLLCGTCLCSQVDSVKEEPYVYFNAFSVMYGFTGIESRAHDPAYFKRLAPGNSVAQLAPDHAKKVGAGSENTGNTMFSFGLNIHLKTKDLKAKSGNFSSEWRAGLNIATNVKEKYIANTETMLVEDTFYSSHTSMVKYEGRVFENIYQYVYKSKNFYFDISKTYHIDRLRHFSFYTGINFGIGGTYNNRIYATFLTDTTTQQRRRYANLENNANAVNETTKLKSEIYYNAAVPIGMIVNPGNKRGQKAYNVSFFAEARLGYRFQKELSGSYTRIPLGALMAGAKMYFKTKRTGP